MPNNRKRKKNKEDPVAGQVEPPVALATFPLEEPDEKAIVDCGNGDDAGHDDDAMAELKKGLEKELFRDDDDDDDDGDDDEATKADDTQPTVSPQHSSTELDSDSAEVDYTQPTVSPQHSSTELDSDSAEECSICLDSIINPTTASPCNHSFCSSCILSFFTSVRYKYDSITHHDSEESLTPEQVLSLTPYTTAPCPYCREPISLRGLRLQGATTGSSYELGVDGLFSYPSKTLFVPIRLDENSFSFKVADSDRFDGAGAFSATPATPVDLSALQKLRRKKVEIKVGANINIKPNNKNTDTQFPQLHQLYVRVFCNLDLLHVRAQSDSSKAAKTPVFQATVHVHSASTKQSFRKIVILQDLIQGWNHLHIASESLNQNSNSGLDWTFSTLSATNPHLKIEANAIIFDSIITIDTTTEFSNTILIRNGHVHPRQSDATTHATLLSMLAFVKETENAQNRKLDERIQEKRRNSVWELNGNGHGHGNGESDGDIARQLRSVDKLCFLPYCFLFFAVYVCVIVYLIVKAVVFMTFIWSFFLGRNVLRRTEGDDEWYLRIYAKWWGARGEGGDSDMERALEASRLEASRFEGGGRARHLYLHLYLHLHHLLKQLEKRRRRRMRRQRWKGS